jgi:ketosteroid isomerase-like protein
VSEESTTPDLAELAQRVADAMNAGDIDGLMGLYAPDVVFEMPQTLGILEGRPALRALLEDWLGAFDEVRVELEARHDLGNGVIFAAVVQHGRLRESTGWIQFRYGNVSTVVDGLIERAMHYLDPDEARAAAERLAKERG